MSEERVSLAELWHEERDKLLEERGITLDQLHREFLDEDVERVRAHQRKPIKQRLKDSRKYIGINFDEGLLGYISASLRAYVYEAQEVGCLKPEEMQLLEDFEKAERDYPLLADVFGIVTDEKRAEIDAQRMEVFSRLAKMLPRLWI